MTGTAGTLGSRYARTQASGFLLLVVVGLLAVLLSLCVGFLSYTRTEVRAVEHVRDKIDARDVSQSALDWTIANISSQLFTPAGLHSTNYITNASGAAGHWWYKPWRTEAHIEPADGGTGHWSCPPAETAAWVELPQDHFPSGGVRARVAVQVLDTNAAFNFNDWLEDCMPSQCQMTHLMRGALWHYSYDRALRTVVICGYSQADVAAFRSSAAWDLDWGFKPFRYLECWRWASRTVRPTDRVTGMMPPNWITTNTSWFWPTASSMHTFRPGRMCTAPAMLINGSFEPSFGTAGPGGNNMQRDDYANFQSLTYVDPDTGRSPINVNTVYLDDRTIWSPAYSYSCVMEGVFNLDALRRIIKLGKFYHDYGGVKVELDTQVPAAWQSDPASPEWLTHERLRLKLAQQYQETLLRYFTARYSRRGANSAGARVNYPKYTRLFPVFDQTINNTYVASYSPVLADAAGVIGCPAIGYITSSNDPAYSKVRFPYTLQQFRDRVKTDLTTMTQSSGNTTANNRNPAKVGALNQFWLANLAPASGGLAPASDGLYKTGAEAPSDVGLIVDCDQDDDFSVLPGKMDRRVASAVYDNIVPGKALLFPGIDPLTELFSQRIGRDENQTDRYYDILINPSDKKNTAKPPADIGRDIALNSAPDGPYDKVASVPDRQLVFGPDWFSTELTTTTTTFIFVVRAQVVDGPVATPRVLEERNFSAVVELAPDVIDESSAAGATGTDANGDLLPDTGLAYYRGDWPKTRKASAAVMDQNCATLPQQPAAPYQTAYGSTTVTPTWTDFRNFAPAEYASPKQVKKNVIIRAVVDLSNTFQ